MKPQTFGELPFPKHQYAPEDVAVEDLQQTQGKSRYLTAVEVVSSPSFTLFLKDYVKILEELNGHSRAAGRAS